MLALQLPSDVEERLSELSKRTGRSESFYALEAIIAHLDDLEDLYLAESRLDDLQAGRSETRPLSDVMTLYDLDD